MHDATPWVRQSGQSSPAEHGRTTHRGHREDGPGNDRDLAQPPAGTGCRARRSRRSATARCGWAAARRSSRRGRTWRRRARWSSPRASSTSGSTSPADVAAAHAELTRELPRPLPARHRHRPPGGDERLHAAAEDDARVLRRARRRADAGAARRARARPRSARRCSTSPASARSAPTRTSRRPSTRASPASASARTRWSRPSSPSSSSRTPRPRARAARGYAKTYLGLTQLHGEPAALRLHRGRPRRRRQRPADRRGHPARLAEAIADAVRAHLDAGADHVCVQPLGHGAAPVEDYRALAAVLL